MRWKFDDFVLDAGEATLYRHGKRVVLPTKAFALLNLLVEQHGHLVRKEVLLDAIWPRGYVDESALKASMAGLRKALNDDPKSPRYIETVFKHGYRFIATVVADGDEHDTLPAVATDCTEGLADWGALISCDRQYRIHRPALMGAFRQALQRLSRRQRATLFLSGEAGIGKTTAVELLLEELRDHGVGLLWGQCVDHYGAGEAFLPLLEALARPCRQDAAASLVARMRQEVPSWLEQFPWVLSPDERMALRRETMGATKGRMLREICDFIDGLSRERPIVMVLEDLHWCDYATLDFIASSARRRDPAAVLLIGTYRPLDATYTDHPITKLTAELAAHDQCAVVDVGPLDRPDVAAYWARRFPQYGDHPAAGMIYQRSEGNPLFMVKLADHVAACLDGQHRDPARAATGAPPTLAEDLPSTLRSIIQLQIDRLPRQEQQLLRAASAAGLEFEAPILALALGRTVAEVDVTCDQLAGRGEFLMRVIDEVADGLGPLSRYAFLHALYVEALYEQLSSRQRQTLHGALGVALENAYGEEDERIAPKAARHFEAAQDYEKAIRYLSLAALHAARHHANKQAFDYLEHAIRLLARLAEGKQKRAMIALLWQRVRLWRSSFDMTSARRDLEALLELAQQEASRELEVHVMTELAGIYFWSDRRKALAQIELAAKRARDLGDETLAVQTECSRGYWRIQLLGWNPADADACEHGLEDARRRSDRRLTGIRLCNLSTVHCYSGRYRLAADYAQQSMNQLLEVGDEHHYYMVSQHYFAWAKLHLGDFQAALSTLRNYIAFADKNGNPAGVATALADIGWIYSECCQYELAIGYVEQALMSSAKSKEETSFTLGSLILGRCYLGLQKHELAFRHLHEILVLTRDHGVLMESPFHLLLHHGLTWYWYATGAAHQSRASAEKLRELSHDAGENNYRALAESWLAKIEFKLGKTGDAEEYLKCAIDSLSTPPGEYPLAAWRVYLTAAELTGLLGRSRESGRFYDQSLQVLKRLARSGSGITESDQESCIAVIQGIVEARMQASHNSISLL